MRTGQQLEAFSTTFGLLASLLLHAAVFGYVASRTADFDFDFDLTLPAEVEFGLTEGMAATATPSGTARPSTANPAIGELTEDHTPELDAGVPDSDADSVADTDTDAGTDPDADTRADTVAESDADAETDTDTDIPVGPSAIAGPSRIPPGAQLALRIDMKRIRESPLGQDVTRFLSGVPDWQLLLAGSGIDPVEDLDRLLVASPNLERSKLVLAGRHHRGRTFAEASVRLMARARGKPAPWKSRYGVRTAPWHNLDRTKRTLAVLSPRHFTITRRQDLRRVLALAKARELRDAKEEGLIKARGPDALLSMGPEEALSLEIEGVHRFVRGNLRHIPTRLRVAVRETGPDEATVTALAMFASDAEARDASIYWKRVAGFYSQQLVMTLAGFGKTLRRMKLDPKQERIEVSFTLTADQIRFILSYLEGRLRSVGSTSRPPRAPSVPNQPSPAAKPGAPNEPNETKKGP
ncbi:MAG: MSCRAMM family adhesin SdrC [Myxococcales bacterium]|nr:MSCRAMM family adhesin SdrC [Myxococcales bacterium]